MTIKDNNTMQKILYALIISIIFSCNVSYPIQQSMTIKTIPLLAYVVTGCACGVIISSYILLHPDQCSLLKYSFLNWFQSVYHKIKNLAQTFNTATSSTTTPSTTTSITWPIKLPNITAENLDNHFQLTPSNKTKLHTACETNDFNVVISLINQSTTDINAVRDRPTNQKTGDFPHLKLQGETPLHIACKNKNIKIVKALLASKNIDITIHDKNGDIPLHIACRAGFNQMIIEELLTRNPATLNTRNINNQSAIDLSYLHKHTDIFNFLLNQTDIDLKNLLTLVCDEGDMDRVQLLLNHKNIQLNDNKPLYAACIPGHCDIVTLLLTYNQNDCMKINSHAPRNGYNHLLLVACQRMYSCSPIDREKFATIIKTLLKDSTLDSNIKDEAGITPLHYATSNDNILQLLLKKDARYINEQSTEHNDYGSRVCSQSTPLHYAITKGNLQSIFLLLQYGADISITDAKKNNPLALACIQASGETTKSTTYTNIVEKLLDSKYIDSTIINESDCLHKAEYNYNRHKKDNKEYNEECNTSVSTLLLKHGADPNRISKKFHTSPLLEVAQYQDVSRLNLFIDEYKGDIKQENKYGSIFYVAFMSKTITDPNQINFFKNLKTDEKNTFMERELTIIAKASPKNILIPDRNKKNAYKTPAIPNDFIILFNSFIATCLGDGNIDLTKKITNNQTLLDISYEQLKRRHKNFYSSKKPYKPCMEDTPTTSCNHGCKFYIQYNELIMHALIQHSNPTVVEQVIDKKIASTYKEKPTEYYLLEESVKVIKKDYIT